MNVGDFGRGGDSSVRYYCVRLNNAFDEGNHVFGNLVFVTVRGEKIHYRSGNLSLLNFLESRNGILTAKEESDSRIEIESMNPSQFEFSKQVYLTELSKRWRDQRDYLREIIGGSR